MTPPAVVMAAGLGTRLRPLTERWAKPVLPLDGRPVVATLVRELAAAGGPAVTVVTGHLAEQVRGLLGDGAAFGVELRYVDQPSADGSADAVRRAGAEPPYLAVAADTLFAPGTVASFAERFAASGAAGAIAIRRAPHKARLEVEAGAVRRVVAEKGEWTGAPLWALGPAVHERLCLDARPWELGAAFQAAIDAGERIEAIDVPPTRDLTEPLDLVRENFPYLRGLT